MIDPKMVTISYITEKGKTGIVTLQDILDDVGRDDPQFPVLDCIREKTKILNIAIGETNS